ncbi:DUF5677 domain-containing protein [Paenibacillus sp. FSL R7-0302]|uniref:DUF5677 domain-containing protein n=1 Tax=Paenibacillus sp. FSL R7-0302 TaxID=2921681 RepID=UPI0030F579BF
MRISNIHDLLEYSLAFGNTELQAFQTGKDLTDTNNQVISSLFRSIIELSVGVKVSAENGLRASAELNFRSLLEAYVAFKYILIDPQKTVKRACAYKVGYHLQQIESATDAIDAKDEIGTNIQRMNEAIRQHTDIINQSELKPMLDEFERLKRTYYPKWYSLFGGPLSLKQLVQNLGEQDLVYSIYGSLSKSAHNYIALRALTQNGLLPVRSGFNPDNDTFNLGVICTFLVSSAMRFTETTFPEYMNHLLPFLQEYKAAKTKLGEID